MSSQTDTVRLSEGAQQSHFFLQLSDTHTIMRIAMGVAVHRAYKATAPRRPTNLSLNADLVEKARAAHLNLSMIAEKAIGQELARVMAERHREEIARSVAEHAIYLTEFGSLADAVRSMAQDSENA